MRARLPFNHFINGFETGLKLVEDGLATSLSSQPSLKKKIVNYLSSVMAPFKTPGDDIPAILKEPSNEDLTKLLIEITAIRTLIAAYQANRWIKQSSQCIKIEEFLSRQTQDLISRHLDKKGMPYSAETFKEAVINLNNDKTEKKSNSYRFLSSLPANPAWTAIANDIGLATIQKHFEHCLSTIVEQSKPLKSALMATPKPEADEVKSEAPTVKLR